MKIKQEKLIKGRQALESTVKKYNEFCDASIKNALNMDGFYTSEEITNHLNTLQEEGRNLKIGIIGRVKAGKSSLINALLFDGMEVLPKAATPMTAALTSIGYADEFKAEVRFFEAGDIDLIKAKAEQFEKLVKSRVKSLKAENKQRCEARPDRPCPVISEQDLRKTALREVRKDTALAAAQELYEKIQATDVDYINLGESCQLTANSYDELKGQLNDYVGSSGKYMPFTRELHLGMPLESMKGIEVLDTPGINDPIKSREQRTYELLKDCSVAFIVSPAGQFMSEQDFDLAERLNGREGTQEIYIVASQVDLTLSSSSVKNKAKGVFVKAIENVYSDLEKQAVDSLSRCQSEVLTRIAKEQSSRLILTSGICETLIHGKGQSDDESTQHAMDLLKKNYPDYFSNSENTIINLKLLSGRDGLEKAIASVREKKNEILAEQANSYIDAQLNTLKKIKDDVLVKLEEYRNDIETGDKADIEKKLQTLKKASAKGEAAVNNEFLTQLEEMSMRIPSELERVIEKAVDQVDEKTDSAVGTKQESYTRKKKGLLSGLGRILGVGGYEDYDVTVTTLKPAPVRRLLDRFARLMHVGLKNYTTQTLLHKRKDLISGISRQLRESMGDESIDITRLQNVCRNIVNNLLVFPEVKVPELPSELAKSRQIKGSSVDDFIEAKDEYVSLLEKTGYKFINDVRLSISRMEKKDIGVELFSDLMDEMKSLQNMIENRSITLEKMARMKAELDGI